MPSQKTPLPLKVCKEEATRLIEINLPEAVTVETPKGPQLSNDELTELLAGIYF